MSDKPSREAVEDALKWADEIGPNDTLYHSKYVNFVVRTLAQSYRAAEAHSKAQETIAQEAYSETLAMDVRRRSSEQALAAMKAQMGEKDRAWQLVRTRVICAVDHACGEHGFKEAMDAVKALDALSHAEPKEK